MVEVRVALIVVVELGEVVRMGVEVGEELNNELDVCVGVRVGVGVRVVLGVRVGDVVVELGVNVGVADGLAIEVALVEPPQLLKCLGWRWRLVRRLGWEKVLSLQLV